VLRDAAAYKTGPRSPIFPSPKGDAKPLSENALLEVMARYGEGFTVHGFRSSFRNWTEIATSFPHEVKESALAHAIANKTEAAYRRLDYLPQRMELMDQWGAFLCDDDPEAEAAMDRPLRRYPRSSTSNRRFGTRYCV
jgi:integrase